MVTGEAILVFGKKEAKYHPLEPVGKVLGQIYEPTKVVLAENRNHLLYLDVQQYSMVILYQEFEEEPMTSFQGAGLLQYVAGGGKLLVLHNGISVQDNPELAQMIGGKFLGHPPYTELPVLEYDIEDPEDFCVKGMEAFSLSEEIYQFDMDDFAKCRIICSFRVQGQNDGRRYPAIWSRPYGMGTVIYCAPGHRADNLMHPEMQHFLRNVYEL